MTSDQAHQVRRATWLLGQAMERAGITFTVGALAALSTALVQQMSEDGVYLEWASAIDKHLTEEDASA
jgi:hypothetical protein